MSSACLLSDFQFIFDPSSDCAEPARSVPYCLVTVNVLITLLCAQCFCEDILTVCLL